MTVEFNPASRHGRSPKTTREKKPRKGAVPSFTHVKLVIGLGNPGSRYARTYHNAGRIAARALAGVPESQFLPNKLFLLHRAEHRAFALPETFMNESGRAAAAARGALRAKPDACLVIHDDVDLPLGSFRLQYGRGSAGHRGVESVTRAFGTKGFWRLRLGARPVAFAGAKAAEFVLHPMTKAAEAAMYRAIEEFKEKIFEKE